MSKNLTYIRNLFNEYKIEYSDEIESATISETKKVITFNKNFIEQLTKEEFDYFFIYLIKFIEYDECQSFIDIEKFDIYFCQFLSKNDLSITFFINFLNKCSKILNQQKFMKKRIDKIILDKDILILIRKEKINFITNV